MCSACLAACLNPLESRDRRDRAQNERMCDKTKEIKQTRHPEHVMWSKPHETVCGRSITNVHSFNFIISAISVGDYILGRSEYQAA